LTLYPDDEMPVVRLKLTDFAEEFDYVHVTGRLDAEGMAPVRVSSRCPERSSDDLVQLGNDGNPSVPM
jgi:hypothetical protein